MALPEPPARSNLPAVLEQAGCCWVQQSSTGGGGAWLARIHPQGTLLPAYHGRRGKEDCTPRRRPLPRSLLMRFQTLKHSDHSIPVLPQQLHGLGGGDPHTPGARRRPSGVWAGAVWGGTHRAAGHEGGGGLSSRRVLAAGSAPPSPVGCARPADRSANGTDPGRSAPSAASSWQGPCSRQYLSPLTTQVLQDCSGERAQRRARLGVKAGPAEAGGSRRVSDSHPRGNHD